MEYFEKNCKPLHAKEFFSAFTRSLQYGWNIGESYTEDFSNGYAVSVIRNRFSYGGKQGLWELAVMKDDEPCYTTPITDDVLGWLEPKEVTVLIEQIKNLPKIEDSNDD